MNLTTPNRLTRQEQRLYEMLRRGGCYTIGIAVKRVTRPDRVNYKLYWLAD